MNTEFSIYDRFEQMSDIEKYSQLVKFRDLLKDIQQLSWNINVIEKKFPLEQSFDKDYKDLLKVYIQFGEEINGISRLFREEMY